MKKYIYNSLIIVGVTVAIIIVDTIIALNLDTSPFIKIREYYDGGNLHYKDKGILVDTYCGTNGIKDTVIKGFSYSLAYDPNITIIDKSEEIVGFSADTALDPFYEDDNYVYSYPCIISDYIIVKYSDGTEETVKEALKNNRIEIGYLDKFDIEYIKQEKFQMYQETPPQLFVYTDKNTSAEALIGTYSWKIIKGEFEEVLISESLHPAEMKYTDTNTLRLTDTKINLHPIKAEISNANIYNMGNIENIKKISFDKNTLWLGDLKSGEYALEIVLNFSQGNVHYGVKLVVE